MDRWILNYKEPAKTWTEALPLGNGSLGVMSYGRLQDETFELNLDTLWSGDGSSKLNKNSCADLEYLRKLLTNRNYQEAEEYCSKNILGDWTDSYLPAGKLNVSLQMPEETAEKYIRQLSLNHALETVTSAGYRRELFVSMADSLLAVHFQAEQGKKLHLEISMESEIKHEAIQECENTLILSGQAPSYVAPPYYNCPEPIVYEDENGILFTLAVKAVAPQGSVKCCDGRLLVDGEQDVFIYFTGNTNFCRDMSAEALKKECQKLLDHADYEFLKVRHLEEYYKYFNRMELSLNDTKENQLVETMFHFVRYLMICSSKPGSQCTNLQGIWNNKMRAPWSSNYTVNINTEMNYWMAERCNLSECQEPLFDLVCRTAEDGKKTAEKVYGLSGWVSHHNLDIWGHSGPVGYSGQDADPCSYSMWPMSSGWLCRHFWEHYCYTEDIDFLKNKAYPIIEGAVKFYLGFLFPYEEYYVTGPSTSPENRFQGEDGNVHSVSIASTMDISILKELFGYYLKICNILNVDGISKDVKRVLEKLPPFKIGKYGQIQEWFWDYPETEIHHRHVSHLYGLYPGTLITEKTPELLDACRKTLERRGDEGTGWCMAWKACLWARLHDGDHAMALLRNQLRYTRDENISLVGGGIYPNMLCAHPPFQIDGNFGFAAAMAEMLLQSSKEHLFFLPALPAEWKDGKVRGMKAPGGITADFEWKEGRMQRICLYSPREQKVTVECNGISKTILLKPDETEKIIFE